MVAIERAGLVVQQSHAEGSVDQFEIPLGPLPVCEAVDAVYIAREIVKTTALRCGYFATFLPMPFQRRQPSGLHLHLSMHPCSLPDHNKNPEVSASGHASLQARTVSKDIADQFLTGILGQLGSLFALSVPSQDSYLRTIGWNAFSSYVAWGRENQSVPVNEISQGYWEIRSLDWTANIYFAVAAYISAGLLGVKTKKDLMLTDPEALVDSMDPVQLQQFGIDTLLPKNADEALKVLISSQYGGLQQILGEEILDLFVVVKRRELEYMRTLGLSERMTLFLQHV